MEPPPAKIRKSNINTPTSSVVLDLTEICDWKESEAIAIKHYEVDEMSFTEITYAQLAAVQLCVSRMLINANCSHFVGIASDISAQSLPGLMLGVMSTGRAFVCLPALSRESKRICDKLNICHIFTQRDNNGLIKEIENFTVHGKRTFLTQAKEPNSDLPEFSSSSEHYNKFAYAITTSGSTGEPKIVRVTHSSIVPNIIDLREILNVSKIDIIAQLTPVTFDPSMIEIFLSLSCNAKLLTISQEIKNNPHILLKILVNSKVSILQTTPSLLLHKWSHEELKKSLLGNETDLRIILLGGEDFPNNSIISKIQSVENQTRIFNIYGITEISCWSSICEIHKYDRNVGLGRILSETIFQVRNETGKIIEDGEGILYIGSNSRVCLIDDEDITLLNSTVFRNTGDVVEIDRDGLVSLKGRKDRRVKRYGTILDLALLEKQVCLLFFVENCRALFNDDNQSLHFYFTTFDKSPIGNKKIEYTTAIVRVAEIFGNICHLDKIFMINRFKLTSHGKICDHFLKKHSQSIEHPELRDKIEEKFNAVKIFDNIWKRFLPFDNNSGFLDMGGSSIVALRIADELANEIGHKFPELIGHLLRNENFYTCRAYVERQMPNLSKSLNDVTIIQELSMSTIEESPTRKIEESSTRKIEELSTRKIEESSTSTIGESPEQFEPEKSKKNNKECKKHEKRIVNSKIPEIIIPWQKCRGRSSFPLSMTGEEKISLMKYRKLRMHSRYYLDKCVDASPTIFCYPGEKNYVTVGSHAGIIYTVALDHRYSQKWKVSLPDRIEASILVVNDFRGIVGTYDGFLYCIDLKTGKIFWKFKTNDAIKCTAVICSRKKNIFFGSYDRKAYCVSLENGLEIWNVKAGNGSISATPCIHDGLDCVIFASLDGTCVSLNQENGEINWKKKLDYPVFSGPVILDDGICVFCDVSGRLDGIFVANGEKAWQINIDGNIFSHLLVHTDPTTKFQSLIFGSENKNVYKFDCSYETIRPICRFTENFGVSVISTPSSDGRVIVVAGINGTLKISKFINGNEIANVKLDGEIFSSPLIHDDFIVVGCRDNHLYIYSLNDGKL